MRAQVPWSHVTKTSCPGYSVTPPPVGFAGARVAATAALYLMSNSDSLSWALLYRALAVVSSASVVMQASCAFALFWWIPDNSTSALEQLVCAYVRFRFAILKFVLLVEVWFLLYISYAFSFFVSYSNLWRFICFVILPKDYYNHANIIHIIA